MKNVWFSYLKERFNPLLSITVIFGIATSCQFLDGATVSSNAWTLSVLTLFFTSFLIRVYNDLEDYEKDRVAFPDRPFPRGLIPRKDAFTFIKTMKIALVLFFLYLFVTIPLVAKLMLILLATYLYLQMEGFYALRKLQRLPFTKKLLNYSLIIFQTLFVISMTNSWDVFSMRALSYTLIIFSSFATFALCQKLDPYSHPASLSLVHFYGFKRTFWITLGFIALSALGAYGLGAHLWLWPSEILVVYALSKLFFDPKKFHFAAAGATFSLIIHAWSGIF